jgi:hypothetical protein
MLETCNQTKFSLLLIESQQNKSDQGCAGLSPNVGFRVEKRPGFGLPGATLNQIRQKQFGFLYNLEYNFRNKSERFNTVLHRINKDLAVNVPFTGP